MPNFKLGSGIVDTLRNTARNLANRLVAIELSQFPLTADEIERGLNDPAVLAHARQSQALGYKVITESGTALRFDNSQYPGIDHAVVVQVSFNPHILMVNGKKFWPYAAGACMYNPHNGEHRTHTAALNIDALSFDKVAAVAAWANRVVRAGRTRRLIHHTVDRALLLSSLPNHASTGSLLALWPGLPSILDRDTTDKDIQFWIGRFRNPPRSLVRYAPSTDTIRELGARIKACDQALAMAMMLPACVGTFKSRDGIFGIALETWENRESDPAFTK